MFSYLQRAYGLGSAPGADGGQQLQLGQGLRYGDDAAVGQLICGSAGADVVNRPEGTSPALCSGWVVGTGSAPSCSRLPCPVPRPLQACPVLTWPDLTLHSSPAGRCALGHCQAYSLCWASWLLRCCSSWCFAARWGRAGGQGAQAAGCPGRRRNDGAAHERRQTLVGDPTRQQRPPMRACASTWRARAACTRGRTSSQAVVGDAAHLWRKISL